MALNSRESTIAWVMGGVLVAVIGYYVFNAFFYAPLQAIETDIAKNQKTVVDGNAYLRANLNVKQDLAALQLQTDNSAAAQQVMDLVYKLAAETRSRPNSGFTITNYSSPKGAKPLAVNKTDFEALKFTATGVGTTMAVANFLLKLETAKIPMKVEDVSLTTRKEGEDDLAAEIQISALVYAPKVVKPGTPGAPGARGAVLARGGTTRGAATRGGGTVAASAPASQPALDEIVAELQARRARQLAGLPEPGQKTAAEIEAEMKAQREKEMIGATSTAPGK